jgi:hypothetical protein
VFWQSCLEFYLQWSLVTNNLMIVIVVIFAFCVVVVLLYITHCTLYARSFRWGVVFYCTVKIYNVCSVVVI